MNAEKQKTILLVEDEAIIAMAEKMTLEKFGYRVLAVHHGEDAVTTVAKTPDIDLILMDIDLGKGMDGTETAALILKERDLPIVFLSSHIEPEVVAKTEKITSYGYVVKNSSSTVLDASIKMAFKLFEAKVSEKKKEEALRQSEEILRYIVRHDPNAIAVYDRGLRYLAVSNRHLKDYNVREADIIGRHHYDVFPELPQKWRDVHRRCLAGAIERNDDDHFERPDGSITYNRWECRPWYEADGSIGGIIVYSEVTTERKLAEIKLAQNLDLLTKLARLVPGVIYQYRLDADGRSAFPYASPGMNDIYEVTPEEVREDATAVFARLHPDDYDRVAGAIQASALTLNTFLCEFRVNLPRQGLRWRWSQAHPERLADGGTLWHGIISDITERKLAEEALRASEDRYRAIFDSSPYAILLTAPDGRILTVNAAACRLFAMTEDEIKERGRSSILDVSDPRLAAGLAEGERTGKFHGELTFLRGNGVRFSGEISSVVFKDKDGNPRTSMVIQDITEKQRVEQALRESVEDFKGYFNMSAVGACITSLEMGWIAVNDRLCRMLGYAREELLRLTWAELTHPDDLNADLNLFNQVLAGQRDSYELEKRFIRKDGRTIHTLLYVSCQRNPDRSIHHFLASLVDISELKRAVEALRQSEAHAQALLNAIPDMLFRVDHRGIFLDYRADAMDLYDQSGTPFIGRNYREILPPALADLIEAKTNLALESGALQTFTYQLPVPGKGVRDFEARMIVSGAEEVTAIVRDVTMSHRAEQARREAEERWRDILFSMGDWVWEVDENGVYTYSSEKGQDFLGTSRGDILGKTPFDFMPPEEAARVGPIFCELVSRQAIVKDLENWNVDKNGKRICLLTNGVPILDEGGNLRGYRGVDKDITERKRAEELIQNSLRFQQALMDAVPSPIFYKDASCVYLGGNKAFERYIGLEREQFIGKTVYDLAPADLAEKYDKADKELLENQGIQTYEASVVHADGTRHEVLFHKAVFTDIEGHLAGLIGVILDITERKQAQATLLENNSRLELAMQAADMAWWEMDLADGHVSFAKRKAEMLGYPAQKFKHYQDFVALVHADDREKAMTAMRGHLDGSLPRYEVDYRIATSSGAYIWFHDIGSIGDRDLLGKPLNVTGLVINVSERKKAEAEIQRQLTEKEIMLKEVHHRIKNNIASIGGLLSLHLQTITSPEAAAALQDAIGRIDSMRLLYEKLLLGGNFQDASVKNYIESLAASVVSLFPDLAKVKLNLDVDDFKLDPKRLFPLGIIINELLTNIMKYAFAGKKSGSIKLALAKDGSRVTLNLEDNGIGLPSGFDLSASKGFGLTLVKMLSQQLGGSFSIETHKGTRCRLEFVV